MAARAGIGLDMVLRRYLAGYSLLGYFIVEEAGGEALTSGAELQRRLATEEPRRGRSLCHTDVEMTARTDLQRGGGRASGPESFGTAEAKRRFSELVDRVGAGERFLISRRGRPAVAMVPPTAELSEAPARPPSGLAALAGALAGWDDLEEAVGEIYDARRGSADRPPPDLS